MKLNVLLSAMNLEDYHYIDTLNITGDCVIVNQCDHDHIDTIIEHNRHIRYLETTERGLSKSRNMAIAHSNSDICILCDNDVEYLPDYEQLILSEYEKHPDYDVIIFHVTSEISPIPCFIKPRSLNYITCCKALSCGISFRRERVQGITFNEQIGAGTTYKMGEENAFLYECLRRGLHLHYFPIEIACLRYEPSTWNTGFDKDYLVARGASFYAMTPQYAWLLSWQFALRKYKLYKEQMSFIEANRFMKIGRKELKKLQEVKMDDKQKKYKK